MKYFKIEEFDCQETGENWMHPEFLEKIDELRAACGFPFVISSGYRSKDHSIEKKKERPGKHTEGIAADIKITDGVARYVIVQEAFKLGFTGIGIDKSFVHLDIRGGTPAIWTY